MEFLDIVDMCQHIDGLMSLCYRPQGQPTYGIYKQVELIDRWSINQLLHKQYIRAYPLDIFLRSHQATQDLNGVKRIHEDSYAVI